MGRGRQASWLVSQVSQVGHLDWSRATRVARDGHLKSSIARPAVVARATSRQMANAKWQTGEDGNLCDTKTSGTHVCLLERLCWGSLRRVSSAADSRGAAARLMNFYAPATATLAHLPIIQCDSKPNAQNRHVFGVHTPPHMNDA